jgi:phosphatidylinositol-bisphosphatase
MQWEIKLKSTLNGAARTPGDAYELVDSRWLVGVLVTVFVKARLHYWVTIIYLILLIFLPQAKLRKHVSEVQDATASVGVMGVMGNKVRWVSSSASAFNCGPNLQGGASIRLRLFDSSFCFVCAHLAGM